MGWTGQPYSKYSDCKYEIIESDFSKERHEIVEKGRVGSTFYYAIKLIETGEVWGLVVLTSVKDGYFYTKCIDETSGPYHYKAPQKVLKALSDTDNENALEWRKSCNDYHEARRQNNKLTKIGNNLRVIKDIPYKSSFGGDMTIKKDSIVEIIKYKRSGKAILYNGSKYQILKNPNQYLEKIDSKESELNMKNYDNIEDLMKGERFFMILASSNDERPVSEQLDDNYSYGGGWSPLSGWKVVDFEKGIIQFSDDPVYTPLAKTTHKDRTIFFYQSAWMGEFHADGETFEISRVD